MCDGFKSILSQGVYLCDMYLTVWKWSILLGESSRLILPVLIEASHHEDMLGSQHTTPHIHNLTARSGCLVIHIPATISTVEHFTVTTGYESGRVPKSAWIAVGKKFICSCLHFPACDLVTVQTRLSRLHSYTYQVYIAGSTRGSYLVTTNSV